ncbi:hypothetical protein [Parvularcula dongshanensis]|uniref:CYTH domain-containing protein n=1 Tax=Parvularcula dongshanensis TaxID=1173995 RepID=A0A840I249_9PROT|nr:hypothetical protein [Parvularcula dongshanensis]MBB4658352.1 hypothetical protein [Parvularcula dongshanensis]
MNPERWEYRVWGEAARDAELRLQGEKEIGAEYRTDTYLLTADEAVLPKIRADERFEVKRRLEVRDGFERWVAETSAPFPLGAETVAALLPDAPAHALTDAKALRAYAESLPDLLVLSVRKHRRRFALGDAEAEVTAVQASDDVLRTVGIEAEGFEAALAAAEALGLSAAPNRDYGAALRRS